MAVLQAVRMPKHQSFQQGGKHSAPLVGERAKVWRPLSEKNLEIKAKKLQIQGVFGVRSQWLKTGKNLFEVYFNYFPNHV